MSTAASKGVFFQAGIGVQEPDQVAFGYGQGTIVGPPESQVFISLATNTVSGYPARTISALPSEEALSTTITSCRGPSWALIEARQSCNKCNGVVADDDDAQ
jgi:hypothetical protein